MDDVEEVAVRRHVEVARSRISRPSLALIVTALFQALTSVFFLVLGLFGVGALLAMGSGVQSGVAAAMALVAVLVTLVGVLPPLVVIYGALQMRRMRSYSWAIAAVVLLPSWSLIQLLVALVFTSIFGVLQLPQLVVSCAVAVWALIVLQDLRIYRAFVDARQLGVDR